MNFSDWLNRQGIAPDVARALGWQRDPGGKTVSYDSAPSCRRRVIRIQTINNQSKYIWDEKTAHLPMPALYNLAALDLPGDTVHIANGEKSTAAMITTGYAKVVNTFGEGNRVTEAVKILVEAGIKTAIVYPDNDKPGFLAAQKWQEAGHMAGLTVIVKNIAEGYHRTFGEPFQEKGDTRDIWLTCKGDKDFFRQVLEQSPTIPYQPCQKPAPPKKIIDNPVYSGNDTEAIKARIDIVTYIGHDIELKKGGTLWAGKAPWRNERTASLKVYPDDQSWFDYGEHIGGDVFDYVQRRDHCDFKTALETLARETGIALEKPIKPPTRARLTDQDSPKYTFSSLFFTLLFNIGKYAKIQDHAAAATVYYLAALFAREHPDESITSERLTTFAHDLGHNVSYKNTVLPGLKQLVAAGIFAAKSKPDGKGRPAPEYAPVPLESALATLQERVGLTLRVLLFNDQLPDTITPDWFPDLDIATAADLANQLNAARQPLRQAKADDIGRANDKIKRTIHRIPALYEILNAPDFELHDAARISKPSDFRRWFYLARVFQRNEQGKETTVAQAAFECGTTPRTIYEYQQKAGIVLDEKNAEYTVTRPEDIDLIFDDKQAAWADKRDHGKKIVTSAGEEQYFQTREQAKAAAAYHIRQGKTLTLKIRTGSLERFASEPELEQRAAKRQEKRQEYQHRHALAVARRTTAPPIERPDTALEALPDDYKRDQLALTPPEALENVPDSIFSHFLPTSKRQEKDADSISVYIAGKKWEKIPEALPMPVQEQETAAFSPGEPPEPPRLPEPEDTFRSECLHRYLFSMNRRHKLSLKLIKLRRKTPDFRHGDIRRARI